MNRRALIQKFAAIAAAVALVPAVKAEASPSTVTFDSLVADCTEQGHELSRAPYPWTDGGETFIHLPYPSETLENGATWSERTEVLHLTDDQDGDRTTLLRGWLMGIHALGTAVPRLTSYYNEAPGICTRNVEDDA